jgi:hypothetical protein
LADAVLLFKSRIFAGPVPLPSHPYRETLASFLDTLIPADETPSATQAGMADVIQSKADKDERYRQFLEQGCAWLDDQARRTGAASFALLNQAARDKVVGKAELEPAGTLPRQFFEQTAEVCFFLYYSRPDGWKGLRYDGPPQPRGFLNYTQAPKARA